jgi:pimeloyl-ACP methyl ester carboxylesterase
MFRILIVLVILFAVNIPAAAQRDANAEIVTIQGTDGLTLVGEFYARENSAPAILLLHMLGGQRLDWVPLIPSLTDAGYNVLAVDMRGHGETGGARDWTAAERDVISWLDWLSDQPSVERARLGIIGASIGANLALIGCAYDERCVTVIALSPGLDYLGVRTDGAIPNLHDRSALLVAALDDFDSADSVKTLITLAEGELGAQLYDGDRHGTQLLTAPDAPAIRLIANWMAEHLNH